MRKHNPHQKPRIQEKSPAPPVFELNVGRQQLVKLAETAKEIVHAVRNKQSLYAHAVADSKKGGRADPEGLDGAILAALECAERLINPARHSFEDPQRSEFFQRFTNSITGRPVLFAAAATLYGLYNQLLQDLHVANDISTGKPPTGTSEAFGAYFWLRELPAPSSQLLQDFSDAAEAVLHDMPASPSEEPRPKWDRRRQELTFGGALAKRLKKRAPNQELILDSFEAHGWVEAIDNPISGDQDLLALYRLIGAVRKLNQNIDLITFKVDREQERVFWVPAAVTK
jgi:hypothetical protein